MATPSRKPVSDQSSSQASDWSVLKDVLAVNAGLVQQMVEDQTKSLNVELKDIASDAIKGKMNKSYFTNLKEFSKLIAYDGFNPLVILKLLVERAANYNKANVTDETLKLTVEGVEFNLQKKASLNEDVAMLCTVFLTRGNNLFKILKTISKDAKAAISLKMVNYNIKSDDDSEAAARKRKERVVLSSTDITLSRIAATFPQITLALAKEHQIEGKASLLAIQECYKLAKPGSDIRMPCVLQHGMLASLLSKSTPQEETALRDFCYMFNLEQSMTLQPPNVRKMMMQEPLPTHMESSVKFVLAAINGPMNSDEVRRQLRRGLLEGDDKDLINDWINAGATAWLKAQASPNYSMLIAGLNDQVRRMSSDSTLGPFQEH